MALYRRGKWYWTHFHLNGQRYRLPLKTRDWREAQACEKELIAQASQGKLAASSQRFARLAFSEAADRYLESRRLELSESSRKKECQLLVQPRQFFQGTSLTRVTVESLLAYREWRVQGGVGPAIVNMEMGAIRRILKRAKRWHLVAADIRPLKERRRVGRVLSHGEKLHLLRKAASRPEWQTARCAAILALNTTMRGCELKGLRWRDVDLLGRTLTVGQSKTEAGERVIPLNRDAMAAMVEMYRRAKVVRDPKPEHCVFPACENGKIDPAKPQRSWRTAWRSLTKAAGLSGLRFHDLRHHAITELAESQASDQTTMAIAGHVSAKMLAHYSHVRLEAKRQALQALSSRSESGPGEGGYDTKNDTIQPLRELSILQVPEKSGRRVGTRTPDLYRVKVAPEYYLVG